MIAASLRWPVPRSDPEPSIVPMHFSRADEFARRTIMARTAASKAPARKSARPSRSSTHYSRWTKNELRELRQLARAHMPMREIGRTLGRTAISIRGKAQREGISLKSADGAGYPSRRRRTR
jgi:hypothetical protein